MGALLSLFPRGSDAADDGMLRVGGCRADALAAEFGTPVMAVAEDALRARAREYRDGLAERWPRSRVVFASKAFPCTAVQRVMVEEGLGLDVAGGGEIVTAECDAVIGHGESWEEALESVEWDDGDVLVVGSSSMGPLARVFLGSRATKIVRHSPVPVVLVPRGRAEELAEEAKRPGG